MRALTGLAAAFSVFAALPLAAQTAPGQRAPDAAPPAAEQTTPPPASPDKGPTPVAGAQPATRAFPLIPIPAPAALAADKANTWILDLSSGGRVTIQLRPDIAPKHVERIQALTRQKFYDGLTFHRVIDGFMAQGGDPQGDGQGGSQLPDLTAEFNRYPHMRGVVAMARAENENSANSQFYIMLMPVLRLDRNYTVFGRVTSGMQYVDALEKGEPPASPSRIVHAYLASDNPPPYAPAAAVPEALPSGPMTPAPARPRN